MLLTPSPLSKSRPPPNQGSKHPKHEGTASAAFTSFLLAWSGSSRPGKGMPALLILLLFLLLLL